MLGLIRLHFFLKKKKIVSHFTFLKVKSETTLPIDGAFQFQHFST